eukprot:29528-Chlamydomonas_euryale.AAC.2
MSRLTLPVPGTSRWGGLSSERSRACAERKPLSGAVPALIPPPPMTITVNMHAQLLRTAFTALQPCLQPC